MAAAAEIEREIATNADSVFTLQRDYFSQSIDASAMEAPLVRLPARIWSRDHDL
jgi:hypothetical protein